VVSNTGTAPTTPAEPVVVTLDLPAGLSFQGASNLQSMAGSPGDPEAVPPPGVEGAPAVLSLAELPGASGSSMQGSSQPASGTWSCAPAPALGPGAGQIESCTWTAPASSGATSPVEQPGGQSQQACGTNSCARAGSSFLQLGAGQVAVLLAQLSVAPDYPATAKGSILTVSVSVSAPGNSPSRASQARPQVLVATGQPQPQLIGDVSGTTSVQPGSRATIDLQFLNGGSGAATPEGGQPSIVVTDPLPPSLVGSWSATGQGWSCTGAQDAPPRCEYLQPVPPGSVTSTLAIEYTLAPSSAAKLHLVSGGKASPESWTVVSEASSRSGARVKMATAANVLVVPLPGSILTVAASVPSGATSELLPGEATVIDVAVRNVGQEATAGKVSVEGVLPAGVSFRGAPSLSTQSAGVQQQASAVAQPWSCTIQGGPGRFECVLDPGVAIPPGGAAGLAIEVSADPTAAAEDATGTFTASAANLAQGVSPASTTVPVFVLGGDAGLPELVLWRGRGRPPVARLNKATDGSPAAMVVGRPYTERLDIRDAGGAEIAAGRTLELHQSFGKAVAVVSASGPSGWRCTRSGGSSPSVACTLKLKDVMAPSEVVTGPTIVVVPHRAVGSVVDWKATVRRSGLHAPPETSLPVMVTVSALAPSLTTRFVIVQVPTGGGTGKVRVWARNSGYSITRSNAVLTATVPGGVEVTKVTTSRWSCDEENSRVVCTSRNRVDPGPYLPPVDLRLAFRRGLGGRSVTLKASVQDGSAPAPQRSRASMQVEVRPAIRASISMAATTVMDVQPLVTPGELPRPSVIEVSGEGSGGDGRALSYRWSQLCVKDAAASLCGGRLAPRLRWQGTSNGKPPTTAAAVFAVPPVKRLTPFSIRLTVSDGSATASVVRSFTVVPPTPASQGVRFFDHEKAPSFKGRPAKEVLRLPAPDQRVEDKRASVRVPGGGRSGRAALRGWSGNRLQERTMQTALVSTRRSIAIRRFFLGAVSHQTTETTSPETTLPSETTASIEPPTTSPETTLPSETTASVEPPIISPETTLPSETTASIEPPIISPETTIPKETTTAPTIPSGVSPLLCEMLAQAISSAGDSFSFSLPGGVSVDLRNVKANTKSCEASSSISFSDSTVSLGSFLTTSALAGEVTKEGVRITSGRIALPPSWRAPTLSVKSSAKGKGGILIAFPGGSASASVAVTGEASGDGFAFLPLPSGWSATTNVSFSLGTGDNSFGFHAAAKGPSSDTSQGSPLPEASISGKVSASGAFSLAVSASRVIQLQGHAIDLSGSVSGSGGDSPVSVSVSGSLTSPLEIAPGLTVSSLAISWSPGGQDAGLSGRGQIDLSTGGSQVGIGFNLAYSDPKNWSLNLNGTGSASWQPLPSLTVSPADFHGAIEAKGDRYVFAIEVAPSSSWTPASGVSVSALKMGLTNVCDPAKTGCPDGASLYLSLQGQVIVLLPSVGQVSANLAGVVGLPKGDFRLEASISSPVKIASGFSLDSAELSFSRYVASPPGTPQVEGEGSSNGVSVSLRASATLPVFGSLPVVNLTWSSTGLTAWSNLGSFSLPGASEGQKLTDTIIAWSSGGATIDIVDPVTKLLEKVTVPADTFEVSGAFTTPSWVTQLLHLPGSLSGRATGSVNTSTGAFALKMSLTPSPDWYLYGDASSATNARLASAYIAIERSAGDFSIGLGGTAALNVAGSGSTSASSVDLGVALGFSAKNLTVSGELTLTSQKGWVNAFGVDGLTVYDLAVAFQLDLKTLTPGLGFGASAVLPASVREPLGFLPGAKTVLVANLSIGNPCFAFQVSNPNNPDANVIDVANQGLVLAKSFDLEIAPNGCTVGTFHFDPGISLAFNGTVANVPVALAARLSVTPFSLDATVDIGEFTVASVAVDKTHFTLSVTPTTLDVTFAGGVHVMGADIAVTGGFHRNERQLKIDFTGSVENLSLGSVVSIKTASLEAHVVSGPSSSASFAFVGNIDLMGSTADAKFTLGIANGVLQRANADVKARVVIGGASGVVLDGMFKLDYVPSETLSVDADVSVSAGGFTIANATALIRPTRFTMRGSFAIGDVFSATVVGGFFWGDVPSGAMVLGPNGDTRAQAGDFFLRAENVSVNLAGFRATGSVSVGRASGVAWASIDTTVQLVGSGSGNSVAVKGSIASNGDFSLSGAGSLNLVGLTMNVAASVSKQGYAVSVSASGSLSVLGSRIDFSGSFESGGQPARTICYQLPTSVFTGPVVSVFASLPVFGGAPKQTCVNLPEVPPSPHFRLTGSATLSPGGFNLGNAAFTISNYPDDAGLTASVNLTAGSVLNVSGMLAIIGGDRFYFGASASLNLVVLTANGNITFTNCTNSSCSAKAGSTTLDASAQVDASGFSFGITTRISSNGSFSATAQSPANGGEYYGQSGEAWFAVVAFYATFHYRMNLTVSSSSPYVAVSGGGGFDVYEKHWGCDWDGCGWSGWGHLVGGSASISTNPFHACAYVSFLGINFGGCI
jgi:hypothetical protein